ncbi:MAG: hypothetical protein JW902_15565 [Syntrophaceae bacterium]|nr:hypothetical protein [Syntrophaceae bacterium]
MKTDKLILQLDELLRHVGGYLLKRRSQGPIDGTWEGTQLKSDTDLIAERLIIDALGKLLVVLPVVSEEQVSTHDRRHLHRYWLVDPIDGTASYAGGYNGFVSQIALIENGWPMVAAVYAPALDLMYLAEHGSGATVNSDKISIPQGRVERLVLTDNYPQPRGIAGRLYQRLGCHGYIESGSIGLKICRVADGTAGVFVKDVIVRDWDTAPGHLILHEAGGTICDLKGNPLLYNKDSFEKRCGLIAAANHVLADHIASLISEDLTK